MEKSLGHLYTTKSDIRHAHLAADISGAVDSATKLATARTINGVNFDGTTNIIVVDSSKLPLTGGTLTGTLIGTTISATTITATNINANTLSGALIGNASTATKLATARTITLTGGLSGSASFDGSGDISISATVSGAGTVPWSGVTGKPATLTGYGITDGAQIGADVNFSTLGIGSGNEIWGRSAGRTLYINYRAGAAGDTSSAAITNICNGVGGIVLAVNGNTATYKGNEIATTNQLTINSIPTSDVGGNIWIATDPGSSPTEPKNISYAMTSSAAQTITSATPVIVNGLSVTITPRSTTSKFLIMAVVNGSMGYVCSSMIYRNGAQIVTGGTNNNNNGAGKVGAQATTYFGWGANNTAQIAQHYLMWVDSTGTLAPVTYDIRHVSGWAGGAYTTIVNDRTGSDMTSPSTLVVIEY